MKERLAVEPWWWLALQSIWAIGGIVAFAAALRNGYMAAAIFLAPR
jgi:hypothetical protein